MVGSLNRRLGLYQGSQVSAAVSQRHPFSKLKELRWAVITEKCTRPARTLGYREFWVTLAFHSRVLGHACMLSLFLFIDI